MDDYSPFSASILTSEEYDIHHEDDSPGTGDEEVDYSFLHILPDFSERMGSFFSSLAKSRDKKSSTGEDEEEDGNDLGDL